MKKQRIVSIRTIFVIVIILSTLITSGIIGYLVFSNWRHSAEVTTKKIADDMNQHVYQQIDLFISGAEKLNDENQKMISNRVLDLSNEGERNKFFVGVLSAQSSEIYSFAVGTVKGEYFGARRKENGVIEIMKNNKETGGNSWYYSVNKDFTAGERAVLAGKFDPRTRAWYQAATEVGKTVFSPIYKHFYMDDLTVSVASPVYDESGALEGVLATHLLLTNIGDYLEDIVEPNKGYAVIFEKNSGEMIANSFGAPNFVVQDGKLDRNKISEVKQPAILQIYEQYKRTTSTQFYSDGEAGNFHVNVEEYHKEGLNWLIVSLIPEDILMADMLSSIHKAIMLVMVAVALSVLVYYFIAKKLLNPMGKLLQVSESIASGNLSERVPIVRKDEIGQISESFNKVTDKLNEFINNLEELVIIRTEQLQAHKDQLHLILDSAAEAIYGIDTEGKCTFCNLSCVKLLGYANQEELLGKNMHFQIHYAKEDGTPASIEECKIINAIKKSEGIHVDDEVVWRANGTYFYADYYAYPQIKNGQVIGAVVTFTDISDRRMREDKIQYLSSHDTLTGLYNRRYFEEERHLIDNTEHLPLSVIFADINGLKMTNDIFGHAAGDALIKKSAEILLSSCREDDLIARVGGDEFVILLPKTERGTAEKILARIKLGFSNEQVAAIKCSIALGTGTKESVEQSLDEIISNAEDTMYQDKTLNRKVVNKDIIDTIIETLHARNPREKQHSIVVSELCGQIGARLQLPEPTINKLKREGFIHDIGKIVLTESILAKDTLSQEELERMHQHAAVGYRILNLFDDTLDLAEDVYGHHERWDGNGFPRGLKGEQIPLLSRIISVAERYERILSRENLPDAERKSHAIKEIKEGAGKEFDPFIVELFVRMME